MAIRKTYRFRNFIGAVALIAGFIGTCAWLINRPEVLRHALALANARSAWKIEAASFTWLPLRGDLRAEGVVLSEPKTGKILRIDSIEAGYKLLGFARGKLVMDSVRINGVSAVIPAGEREQKKRWRGRINTAKLLLLKNIEVMDAAVSDIDLDLGGLHSLSVDQLRAALSPSIFGDARFALRADGIKLASGGAATATAGFVSLKTSTRLERWSDSFPYANSFKGRMDAGDIFFDGIRADLLKAEVGFEDGRLALDRFLLEIKGRRLEGRLAADISDQSFEMNVEIPKPLSLPHLGKHSVTFETGGELSGSVSAKGAGFMPSSSAGTASVALSHRFTAAPEHPVSVASKLSWNRGRINVESAVVSAAGSEATASGVIDISGRSIDINASASRLPIEHIFNKFEEPHLKRIFGASDAEARITGWGKGVRAEISSVTHHGGWSPIKAERAETELSISYDKLSLGGVVFASGRAAGTASLVVEFGERMADGRRRKNIDFSASIENMPLDEAMAAYGLKGTSSGSITIRGPHTDFTGTMNASARNGSWHGLPFERASAEMAISRRRLDLSDIEILLSGGSAPASDGSLTVELADGRARLQGEPYRGLSVDATFLYGPGRWNIAGISWSRPEYGPGTLAASGSFTPDGPIDIKISGEADATGLSTLTPSLYRGSGPVSVNLAVAGRSSDPRINGKISFNDNEIMLRNPRVELAGLKGAIEFSGPKIVFDGITAAKDDGFMLLTGHLYHKNLSFSSSDLKLKTRGMTWRSEEGGLALEFEGDLALSGAFPNPTLSGDMVIIDGRYTRDFKLLEAISAADRKAEARREAKKLGLDPKLNLGIRNTGDMEIRNNVGEIWLGINIRVTGTRSKPAVAGSINTDGGKIHYLGLNFDITRGFVELRGEYDEPYIEVYAEKEISVYNVNLVLHGPTDNLALDLTATSPTGPLEKRDVVSLLLFGMTEQDRIAMQREGIQATMVAQTITSVVERPVAKLTGLDVFRFEAPDPESQGISRLNVGKRLSDRLTVSFATDIGVDNAVQTFAAEYQITDSLIVKGSHSTDANYELSGFLRFRLR